MSPAEMSNEEEWLPLGKAAAMLGVHNMTLRRWSDSGRFPCFRTAGGHRRFALSDIQTYLDEHSTDVSGKTTDNWAAKALVQTRRQVAHHDEQRWLKAIDSEAVRSEYRRMGHHLMGLLLQYVAADDANGTFIEEARRIGRRYGAYGMRAGLPLSHIIEATLFFRDILVESSLQVPSTTYVEPESNIRILRRVNQIINTIQLSVTEFYETAGPGSGFVDPD
ncbi:MAG: helix-turn-helix domain-containing protein [Candidatus Promineifilaceae bacterium]|nr:helix-turn-helix domain-containing protein [Candidatus Promineifilaceae bacterium]